MLGLAALICRSPPSPVRWSRRSDRAEHRSKLAAYVSRYNSYGYRPHVFSPPTHFQLQAIDKRAIDFAQYCEIIFGQRGTNLIYLVAGYSSVSRMAQIS